MEQGPVLIISFETPQIQIVRNKGAIVEGDEVGMPSKTYEHVFRWAEQQYVWE